MPSILIGIASGGPQQIFSGNFWSGVADGPIGSVKFKLDAAASGNIYVGFSGNMTMNSGSVFLSGGGRNDGFVMRPGDTLDVPKMHLLSGNLNVFAWHDAAASGQARLFWQSF